MRPKKAGLNCLYKFGFNCSAKLSAVGHVLNRLIQTRLHNGIRTYIRGQNNGGILKSMIRPSPSSSVPLSKT